MTKMMRAIRFVEEVSEPGDERFSSRVNFAFSQQAWTPDDGIWPFSDAHTRLTLLKAWQILEPSKRFARSVTQLNTNADIFQAPYHSHGASPPRIELPREAFFFNFIKSIIVSSQESQSCHLACSPKSAYCKRC